MAQKGRALQKKSAKKSKIRNRIFHRPPPGSSPGTVLTPLDATPTRFIYTGYDSEILLIKDLEDSTGISELIKNNRVSWISSLGLGSSSQIQELCTQLGIHRLTIEDIINQFQRPKVEYFEHYSYISVHIPKIDTKNESEYISIILGQGFVLTFQNSPLDYMESIRNRIQKKTGQIRNKNADYLCYAIIDTVIDQYFPIAEFFAQKLEAAEEEIVSALNPSAILAIYDTGSRLNYIHRILWSHKELISQLIRDPDSPMAEDVIVYLRDCFDHTMQILDFLENQKDSAKTLANLHLSLQTHHSNEIVKFLTIVTSTFIPMTFITGLYGMNFSRESPWNMPELDWDFGYLFAIALMLASAASLWTYFYRRRWFAFKPATRTDIEQDRSKNVG